MDKFIVKAFHIYDTSLDGAAADLQQLLNDMHRETRLASVQVIPTQTHYSTPADDGSLSNDYNYTDTGFLIVGTRRLSGVE